MVSSVRNKVFRLLNGGAPPYDNIINAFVLLLVLGNVVLLIVSSVDSLQKANATTFFVLECVSVGIFTCEYLLRIWVCVEKRRFLRLGPVLGRLRYAVSFTGVIDLLAIAPFYVLLCVPAGPNVLFFSAIRVLRIFRLLKLERLANAFKILKHAILDQYEILLITLIMEAIIFLFVCTLLWVIEPELFPSIPSAMFVSLLMLTGSDLPPENLLSPLGKVFVAISVFLSIAMFALPTGVLAFGFQEVTTRYINAKKERSKKKLLPAPEDSDDDLFKAPQEEEEEEKSSKEVTPLLSADNIMKTHSCPTCGREMQNKVVIN